MKLSLGNGVIILAGDAGAGPTGTEIRTVRRRFTKLFGVEPVIRVRGQFHRDAMLRADATDSSGPDVWPMMNNPEPVVFVGKAYITIRLTYPVAKRRTLRVYPEKGRSVTVRFALPNG